VADTAHRARPAAPVIGDLSVSTVGLTGGIGSGKSTVAAELAACGAAVVDTDALARELTAAGGAAMPALRAALGEDIAAADGALDRARMRERAFADPRVKAVLESVLHPRIAALALERAAAARARGAAVVVFDVPLLVESAHWRARVQRVLVVDCSADVQVLRVARRPGWTEAAARAVIAQQASRPARRAVADAVIVNDGSDLAALQREVRALWSLWTLPAGERQVRAPEGPVRDA
jgi:dephospho-CoA kinase